MTQHFVKRISVSNFKSFRHLDIELSPFNVLIGANASGKSNLLDIFRLLRDIATDGLKNAISMQGGVEYLRNTTLGASEELVVKIVYQPMFVNIRQIEQQEDIKRGTDIRWQELVYEFALSFIEKEYRVVRDHLTRKLAFFEIEEKDDQLINETLIREEEVCIFRVGERFRYTLSDDSLSKWIKEPPHPVLFDDNFFDSGIEIRPNILLLEPGINDVVTGIIERRLTDISIYDFAPKLLKQIVPITGKADLEEDGRNLPVVLKNILENEHTRRKFLNLTRYLLDFVEDVQVDDMAGKYLFLKFKEQQNPAMYLPANLMSEGTVSLLSLLVAAYFQDKPLVMIEEPERNIHPFLIAKVVDMFKEVSSNRQVVITTHNPEIVKQVELADILLMSKDKDGYSVVSKPSESHDVQIFLENEIGVGDLYVQNLLGV